jgi:peptidoglycan hydrolase-like protein with peptidoglycan-binding domain
MNQKIEENKVPLIVGILVLVVVLIYFYQDKLAKFLFYGNDSIDKKNEVTGSTNTAVSSSNSSSSNDTILKKGSSGEKVQMLQGLLNVKHGNNKPQIIPYLVADGKFGTATESMLKKWTGKTSISINELTKALK